MIFGLVVIFVCQSLVLSFVLKIKVRQIISPASLLDGYFSFKEKDFSYKEREIKLMKEASELKAASDFSYKEREIKLMKEASELKAASDFSYKEREIKMLSDLKIAEMKAASELKAASDFSYKEKEIKLLSDLKIAEMKAASVIKEQEMEKARQHSRQTALPRWSKVAGVLLTSSGVFSLPLAIGGYQSTLALIAANINKLISVYPFQIWNFLCSRNALLCASITAFVVALRMLLILPKENVKKFVVEAISNIVKSLVK